jgi:hypothetical protein
MRFGTCNTEPLPSECNSLRQVDDRDQNPNAVMRVQNKLPESFCVPQAFFYQDPPPFLRNTQKCEILTHRRTRNPCGQTLTSIMV